MGPNTVGTVLLYRWQAIEQVALSIDGKFLIEFVEALTGRLGFAGVDNHQVVEITIGLGAIAVAIKVFRVPDVIVFPGKLGVVSIGRLQCLNHQIIGVVIIAPAAIRIL